MSYYNTDDMTDDAYIDEMAENIDESVDELCNALNNSFIPNEKYQHADINHMYIQSLSKKDLSDSIQKIDLFYNPSKQPLILLTRNVLNDIVKITTPEELDKYLTYKCCVLQTQDDCYIIYYPIMDNNGYNIQTHSLIYNIGEVIFNLRMNNYRYFMVPVVNPFIYSQVYEYVLLKIKNVTYYKSIEFLNHSIRIKNICVQYGFILWCYFLMKTKQEYERINGIIKFDDKILEVDTIYEIYLRIRLSPQFILFLSCMYIS